jgi:CHASE2 domain-containing sensor protein
MKVLPLVCLLLLLPALALADPPRVIVIGIDSKTQKELGPFGGSYRATHAKLIERLNAAKVKGIAFDVTFGENPAQAAGTQRLAAAAKASRAPVVVGVWTEEQQGKLVKYPSAAVLQDANIGHALVMSRRQLKVVQDGDELVAEAGAMTIVSEALGHRSLVEEILRRTGDAKPGQVNDLGLLEKIPTGFSMTEKARTEGLEHGYTHTPGFRPELGKKPRTLSYVDVLTRDPHPALEGAIVIIGMNDGVNDVIEYPDPSKPKLTKISGVYLHAALAQRLLREIPAREAAREAARKAEASAANGDATTRKGLAQLVGKKE